MPAAVKGTFWRITLIYVTSLIIIGLLIPWNEPRLLGEGGAAASPFVIAVDSARIKGLNHFVNITICISVLSIGLSCVYAGSRTLTALAETGYAPKIFAYVDKSGRPLWSVIAIFSFGPLGYINVVAAGDTVFMWLLALSGYLHFYLWGRSASVTFVSKKHGKSRVNPLWNSLSRRLAGSMDPGLESFSSHWSWSPNFTWLFGPLAGCPAILKRSRLISSLRTSLSP